MKIRPFQVEEWMNAGGREVMEEAQAIYDTYMK